MIPNTFEAQLPIALQFDDTKDDRAAGEAFATSYGVTEFSWASAITDGLVANKPLSEATRDDCIGIIRANYFNRCRISALPAGPSLLVFHDALLSGAGHAAGLLNRIVGASSGNAVGSDTIRLANSYAGGPRALIDALYVADNAFLAALKNAPLYLNGWRRAEDVMRAAAYQMLGMTAPAAPTPSTPPPAEGGGSSGSDNSADALMAQEQAGREFPTQSGD